MSRKRAKRHKDVEFAAGGRKASVDMLCHSLAGARWAGCEEQYREDPDASVSERITVKAESIGRVA